MVEAARRALSLPLVSVLPVNTRPRRRLRGKPHTVPTTLQVGVRPVCTQPRRRLRGAAVSPWAVCAGWHSDTVRSRVSRHAVRRRSLHRLSMSSVNNDNHSSLLFPVAVTWISLVCTRRRNILEVVGFPCGILLKIKVWINGQNLCPARFPRGASDSFPFFIRDLPGPRWPQRLARSPPTKGNWVQSPAGSPDFRMCESYRTIPLVGRFYRGSTVSRHFYSGAAPYSPQSPLTSLKISLFRASRAVNVLVTAPRLLADHSTPLAACTNQRRENRELLQNSTCASIFAVARAPLHVATTLVRLGAAETDCLSITTPPLLDCELPKLQQPHYRLFTFSMFQNPSVHLLGIKPGFPRSEAGAVATRLLQPRPKQDSTNYKNVIHEPSREPIRVNEVGVKQRRNERARETEDPRENPRTSGVVAARLPREKIRERPRRETEPGSPRWEASSLVTKPPWPLHTLPLIAWSGFGKLWKTEIRMAVPGIKPLSSRIVAACMLEHLTRAVTNFCLSLDSLAAMFAKLEKRLDRKWVEINALRQNDTLDEHRGPPLARRRAAARRIIDGVHKVRWNVEVHCFADGISSLNLPHPPHPSPSALRPNHKYSSRHTVGLTASRAELFNFPYPSNLPQENSFQSWQS
ncbi:hypothetical protein PR048_010023 [Dryococelus australis]|uniref:Uncharacterized protein n=1 Tax=Dryococelus australis TaxID=614101 RepID=A0ABQ9I2I8_9NEOP|nr:hypothetical protein PR048_010023 [Dryococelus australis]